MTMTNIPLNTNDILQENHPYYQLANFLISYFGDYWNGKTEEYLKTIRAEIERFLKSDLTDDEKKNFLNSCRLTLKPDWLSKIAALIGNNLHLARDS